jgi:hypothetical protein
MKASARSKLLTLWIFEFGLTLEIRQEIEIADEKYET